MRLHENASFMHITSHTSPAIKGSVALVGAGPGDPELLTLKAVRAIASATVILVDDLVSKEVLAHANPSARIVPVGKRGGCKSTAQNLIERLMIDEYRKGERVVRLKGGDPMIFGRAGEELAALSAAGVPCAVINGITSGVAAATGLGISLTHRDCAHGVVFVTGHATPQGTHLDWIRLGQMVSELKLTLVIYMGASHATHIQQGLQVHCEVKTPVAFIESASTPQERRFTTSLGQMAQTLAQEVLHSPLIMVIGEVAKVA